MRDDDTQDTTAELDALAAEAEAIEGEFIGAGEKPTQEDAGAAQVSQRDKIIGTIAGSLDLLHNGVLAPRKGKHWAMPKEESAAHGEAWADIIEKYWPDLQVGPELALLGVLSVSYGARIMIDIKLSKERKAEAENDGQAEEGAQQQEPLGDPV